MTLALVMAVAGAFAYGLASVLQAVAARRTSGLRVMVQPWYIVGLVLDGLGWLASLVALRRLPLFAVESLLAGSLVVTVVLARVFLQVRMRRLDVGAIVAIVLSLTVLAMAAGDQPAEVTPSGFGWSLVVLAVVLAVVTLLLYRSGRGPAFAAMAGLSYGAAALAARGSHGATAANASVLASVGEALWQPAVLAIAILAVVGAVAFARSLERGSVGPMTALNWVVEIVAPGIAGVLVLGDSVRSGWVVPALVAIVVALAGCVVLSNGPAVEAAR